MGMSANMDTATAANPRWENERYLIAITMKQLGITEEDMMSVATVRAKVRDSKIEEILETKAS